MRRARPMLAAKTRSGSTLARYYRPADLAEALAALSRPDHGLTVLAGATDVYPAAAGNHAWMRPAADAFLDISALSGLRGVERTPDGWRLGALATWSDIVAAPLPPAFDGLKAAARQVGGRQIQNRGTLGGNLCNASPAADGGPPLLALGAQVELSSLRGARRMPLDLFLLGNRRTALEADELLTAVIVPDRPAAERSAFLKLGARAYLVISIVSVAVNARVAGDGTLADVRLAFGAASVAPVRDRALEAAAEGLPPAAAAHAVRGLSPGAISPIDDVRASAAYRAEAARELAARAIEALATGADAGIAA